MSNGDKVKAELYQLDTKTKELESFFLIEPTTKNITLTAGWVLVRYKTY